jgi:hypothetical protein
MDFIAGERYPSPATHVIGLDYCDGVTAGVLKTAGGSVYRFEMTGEELNPIGSDSRTFELAPLATGSFDAIASFISPQITPHWPCWVPIWKFSTDEIRRSVELKIDQVLAEAGKIAWRVEAQDLLGTVSATTVG